MKPRVDLHLPHIVRRAPALALLAIACLLVGCSSGVSVRSQGDPLTDFAHYETYAWTPEPPSGPRRGAGVEDAVLRQDIEKTIESHFDSIGLVKVSPQEASLFVRYHLGVENRIEQLDPFYSQDTVAQHEDGVLVLELVEADTRKVVWRGVGRQHLREAARGQGLYSARYREKNGPRNWRVVEVVDATLAGSELMGTTVADRTDAGGKVRERARRDLYRRIGDAVPDPEPRMPEDETQPENEIKDDSQ